MPLDLPSALTARPFSVREARNLGVAPQRLRRVDLERPFRGVRSVEAATGILARCQALATVLEPDQFFSHTTSLALWTLPLPATHERADAPLHVTSRSRREPRRKQIIGHRFPRAPAPLFVDGLPVSAPGDAWADCRELLAVDELVIVGDALVSPWSPVPEILRPSIADLESAVAAVPGRRERLREALTWIRFGSRSPAETRLRLLLARHGVDEPELNAPVDSRDGRVLGHGDMVFRAPRVVVEYEGEHHFTQTETYYSDIDRRERFAEAGWRTVRVTAAHLRQPTDLVARIKRHVGVRLQK